jgi:hypothetical protein
VLIAADVEEHGCIGQADQPAELGDSDLCG